MLRSLSGSPFSARSQPAMPIRLTEMPIQNVHRLAATLALGKIYATLASLAGIRSLKASEEVEDPRVFPYPGEGLVPDVVLRQLPYV